MAISAAALVRDGKLVAAAEEERFRRVKHWAGFPSQAIAYCLREAGVALSDIQHIAVNQDSRANLVRKLTYLATRRPDPNLIISRFMNRRARQDIPSLLAENFPSEQFHGQVHQDRTPSGAPVLGISHFAIRRCGGRFS